MLFVEWLRSIRKDASMIFLMGDFFDFWFEYRKVVPKGCVRSLGQLADIIDSGIPVHFFTGNHDIWAFNYLAEEVGMVLHHDFAQLELLGKRFFLAHGDDLGKKDFGYQIIKKFFHNPLAQWAFAKIHPDLSFRLAHFWSKKSRLSYKDGGIGFKNLASEEQYNFAKSVEEHDHHDYYVFGHRHILLNEPINEKSRIIVLGDWIKLFSFGVFDEDGFRLEKMEENKIREYSIKI